MRISPEVDRVEKDGVIAEIDRLLGLKESPDDGRSVFKIGDLAREFGLTLRALRFYEDRGLLKPERRGTTRLYSRRDRMRLRLIEMAKVLGFSLTEAQQMIDAYDQPNGKRRQLLLVQDRLAEQRKILQVRQEEVARSLKALHASLTLVTRELQRPENRI